MDEHQQSPDDLAAWHQRWKDSRIGFHLDEPNPALTRHWSAWGARSGQRVFVPLCGKSRDIAYLRTAGLEVVGCELSELAVKALFAESGFESPSAEPRAHAGAQLYAAKGVQIYAGNYFDLEPSELGTFDLVFDRAALVAVPPESRAAYIERLQGLLRPGGRLLLVTLTYDTTGEPITGPPHSLSEAEIRDGFPGELRCLSEEDQRETAPPSFRAAGLRSFVERCWLWTK